MPIDFKLPPSIDPGVPVGQLTLDQLMSLYGAIGSHLGHKMKTPEQRSEHARRISAARMACLSPERRQEIARAAARARWAKKAG